MISEATNGPRLGSVNSNGQTEDIEVATVLEELAAPLVFLSESCLHAAALAQKAARQRPETEDAPGRLKARRLREPDLHDEDLCRVMYWVSLPGNPWADRYSADRATVGLSKRLRAAYMYAGVSDGAGNWPRSGLYRVGDIRAMAAKGMNFQFAADASRWFLDERGPSLRGAAKAGDFSVVAHGRLIKGF